MIVFRVPQRLPWICINGPHVTDITRLPKVPNFPSSYRRIPLGAMVDHSKRATMHLFCCQASSHLGPRGSYCIQASAIMLPWRYHRCQSPREVDSIRWLPMVTKAPQACTLQFQEKKEGNRGSSNLQRKKRKTMHLKGLRMLS